MSVPSGRSVRGGRSGWCKRRSLARVLAVVAAVNAVATPGVARAQQERGERGAGAAGAGAAGAGAAGRRAGVARARARVVVAADVARACDEALGVDGAGLAIATATLAAATPFALTAFLVPPRERSVRGAFSAGLAEGLVAGAVSLGLAYGDPGIFMAPCRAARGARARAREVAAADATLRGTAAYPSAGYVLLALATVIVALPRVLAPADERDTWQGIGALAGLAMATAAYTLVPPRRVRVARRYVATRAVAAGLAATGDGVGIGLTGWF